MARARQPRSAEDVRAVLRDWSGPVSVGGGRFSMGGQIAFPDSLHLDMRSMRDVVRFDPARRVVRVQAGATWRDIQDVIDPHDLSVRIMQSYSNFTVGGSVSVNCHGRYVGRGPLVNSVRALQLVTAAGEVLELTRAREAELFRGAFGGYGALGVVTEVELELDPNGRIERAVERVPLERYPEYFAQRIARDSRALLHNADLTPPEFDAPRAITWLASERPLTEPRRLVPRGLDYSSSQNAIWAVTELPGGSQIRDQIERKLLEKPAVAWRNHEASMDTASLEPRTRKISTYLLQEYFIPVARFAPFARDLARILKARRVDALNVSIRHSPADATALLPWAPAEVFSFVLYYKQRTHAAASARIAGWTRELIDAALDQGGRYYLPYRLDATREQFAKAYPEAVKFAALKKRVDPANRFRNMLWERYLA
ncbi:MAG TPA: FAD-binding oxidoreductase [Burkholderiales bacterium]|nr:FAD-binding oxidoreductase [Burkholderiales bacterium]